VGSSFLRAPGAPRSSLQGSRRSHFSAQLPGSIRWTEPFGLDSVHEVLLILLLFLLVLRATFDFDEMDLGRGAVTRGALAEWHGSHARGEPPQLLQRSSGPSTASIETTALPTFCGVSR
jgi:hypothetical protein